MYEEELVIYFGGERIFVLNNKRDYRNLRIVLEGDIPEQRDIDALVEYANSFESVAVVISTHPLSQLNDISFVAKLKKLHSFLLLHPSEFNFDHLKFIPESIRTLYINSPKQKKISLEFINRFQALETLTIENGQRDFEKIGTLKSLKYLCIRSLKFENLDPLLAISSTIESLDIKLGGTTNLKQLPSFTNLKYLELWMIRGLTDISSISETVSLQHIFLQALKGVTKIPDLSKLVNLHKLHLHTMKGISDLSAIAHAPALEELIVEDAAHMQINDFLPIKNHPTLRAFGVGLGSHKKNNGAYSLVGVSGELTEGTLCV